MQDDDSSDIIHSGISHRVSVSERTGNAKTPKNVVGLREDESKPQKTSYENALDQALNEAPPVDVSQVHIEQLNQELAGSANIPVSYTHLTLPTIYSV